MTWNTKRGWGSEHTCRTPGDFRIWLHHAVTGSLWTCQRCGQQWTLRRRTLLYAPGIPSFWEWITVFPAEDAA